LGPQLERLADLKGNFRLLKIDVRDWDSPVATAHGIRSLPTLALYEGKRLVSKDTREVLAILNED